MIKPGSIRREKRDPMSDFWHRLRWGAAIGIAILIFPIFFHG
jgi:hypothetical protein